MILYYGCQLHLPDHVFAKACHLATPNFQHGPVDDHPKLDLLEGGAIYRETDKTPTLNGHFQNLDGRIDDRGRSSFRQFFALSPIDFVL